MLTAFYVEERDTLIGIVNKITKDYDDAEDIVQEAFTRALKYWDTFKGDGSKLFPWFYGILTNVRKDYMADKRRLGMVKDNLKDDDEFEIEDSGMTHKITREFREEIKKQSPEHADVLFLYFEKSYKPEEIAQIVEMNWEAVRKVIARFKIKMKEKYDT